MASIGMRNMRDMGANDETSMMPICPIRDNALGKQQQIMGAYLRVKQVHRVTDQR